MKTEDSLLTVEEVAEMARLRPRTIRAKIHQGLLRAQKPPRGKGWLIQRADAEGMLTGERPDSAPPLPLIDRMGSPAGRAQAVAVLRQLGDDRDEHEQRASAARLREILSKSRMRLRRWDSQIGEIRDEAA